MGTVGIVNRFSRLLLSLGIVGTYGDLWYTKARIYIVVIWLYKSVHFHPLEDTNMATWQASPNHTIQAIHKIAIVDDEKNDAEIARADVKYAGFEPVAINRSFKRVEDLAAFIKSEAQGALCAHRLARYGFTNLYGAKLVAALYDLKIPAVLITQYTDIDKDVSIRKWRDKIPVVLSRDEANAYSIRRGIESCVSELYGHLSETRRPYRVLLRIANIGNESNEKVVDVVIPGWNPYRAVRFPASLVPSQLHRTLAPGVRLFAHVNIGAKKSDDLYFRDFELADEPDDDDGLA